MSKFEDFTQGDAVWLKGHVGLLERASVFCFVASSHRRGGVGSKRELEASLHPLEAFE